MKQLTSFVVAAAGTTGNNNHDITITEDPSPAAVSLEFRCSAVGGTPTATVTLQGSIDGVNYISLPYKTFASDTEVYAAFTVTTVSAVNGTVDLVKHPIRLLRVAVTANTNVTYGITAVSRKTYQ